MMIVTIMSTKNMNPISISIMILLISLMMTTAIFKSTNSSWVPMILIITFSSGMMTLFMYASSLTPNEKMKEKKTNTIILAIMTMTLLMPHQNQEKMTKSMKTFSSYSMMTTMGIILILTMITMALHGHHPNQTLSSSF